MSVWKDYNSAAEQSNFDPIPAGTLAKVRMTIKPGGYDDHNQGWTGGYATQGQTGAVYLNCEFVVLEGQYAKRKVWSLIGLHSPKGPDYGNIGRSFVKGILNSARGVNPKDDSPNAQAARRINGLGDLDGMVFVARIGVRKDQNGTNRNEINLAITPDHKDYAALMGGNPNMPVGSAAAPGVQIAPQQSTAPHSNNRPSWAQ